MADVSITLPQELLDHLAESRLAHVEEHGRVRVALAIHLFLTKQVSIGRAVELAKCGLVEFHHLLRVLDSPTAFYGSEELAQDMATLEGMRLKGELPPAEGRPEA